MLFNRVNGKSQFKFSRRAGIHCIMLIYCLSGICSLIDEVVWVRLLKLILGNTVYASSIVVSIFMGGLALGAVIMSRYADKVHKRLRLYAFLETMITISALAIPFALRLVGNIYVWFYQSFDPPNSILLLVQVVISACILLIPSMLMGSTLPLLGGFVTTLEKEAGHLVGRLYALNTLGAAAGCFLAGFILIRSFGVMGTLYIAAILNIIVASAGYILYRFSPVSAEHPTDAEQIQQRPKISEKLDTRYYLLVFAFFMSGLISISYEILWMRSIVHLLGGATYVFSSVLTIYLLGNVIGAAFGSRLVVRLKRPVVGFSVTLLLLGVCGIVYLPVLVVWSSKVLPHANVFFESIHNNIGISAFTIGPIAQSLFLFLVPAVIMGIGFPIALQGWANHLHKVGRSTGMAYGANTIGAVIGGLLTGFVMIPALGVQMNISILGLIGVWIAGVLFLEFANDSKSHRWVLVGFAIFITLLFFVVPTNLFETVVQINKISTKAKVQRFRLLDVKEGVTTTVSVDRDLGDGALYLYSAGQALAGDSFGARFDQKILGHFGVMLNRDAKTVLTVGFGSGETTTCLAKHDLEQVDCVEIAPEVVDVSLNYFTHINLGDRLNEEVNMIYMDAKNYIFLTDKKYDVIMNDSIHPRLFAENASLYTKEFYQSAKQKLNDGGLILSWVPTYDLPVSVLKSITGSFMEVYPHVTIWFLNNYPLSCIWLVGTIEPQKFSPHYMQQQFQNEKVKRSLAEMNIFDSVDLLSCYVGDKDGIRKILGEYHLNSDYCPFVEFTVDKPSSEGMMFKRFVKDLRTDTIYDHIDWNGFTEKQKEQWIEKCRTHYNAFTELLDSYYAQTPLAGYKHCLNAIDIMPDDPVFREAIQRTEVLFFSEGMRLINKNDMQACLSLSNKIIQINSDSPAPWMLRSIMMLEQGNMKNALAAAQQAVKLAPQSPDAHFNYGVVMANTGNLQQVAEEYKKTFELSYKSKRYNTFHCIRVLNTLIDVYVKAGRVQKAVETAEKAVQIAADSKQQDLILRAKGRLLNLKSRQGRAR